MYIILFIVSAIRIDEQEEKAFFNQPGKNGDLLVFAHQGGQDIRPANTMIAFTHSAELGSDVLDADMHMSSDGVLVLVHDEEVDKLSDGSGAVRDLKLEELRALDFGYEFTTDDGQTYPYRGQGHGIVTLEEMFTEFPDIRFGVEIKQTVPEAADKFCAMIKQFGYEDKVLVSSFAQDNMTRFRKACPSVATSGTTDEVTKFYIAQYLRLPGLYKPPFNSLQVPEERSGREILTDNFVESAYRWGQPIIPWTINETADFQRLTNSYELDGINTNYPDRLIEYLQVSAGVTIQADTSSN